MLAITTSISQLESQARQIARQWGFEFSHPSDNAFYLELTDAELQLVQAGKRTPGPIAVDFMSGQATHRRRFGGGKGQAISRAVGLSKSSMPLIVDATAGLGKDAFVFASLGANVILLERSPVCAALLEDGLKRGRQVAEISAIIEQMHLIHGDSLSLLPQLGKLQLAEQFCHQPEVIYLDPMFPRRSKSAQIKKEMLALQQLVGSDDDSRQLLEISRNVATKRVVVKRPVKADYLAGSKPSFSMPMKKHRFDIYLTQL